MKISYDFDIERIKQTIDATPDSPLFARYADLLFRKGLINEALIVLENGLKKYKLYSTAYIVYAKILFHKGRDEEALEVLNKVLKLLPDCLTAKLMVDKIKHRQFIKRMKGDAIPEDKSETFVRRKIPVSRNEIETIIEKFDNADSLIIKADPNFNKSYEPPNETPEIVTETMYHILVNQGLFDKAYNILLKLMKKNPSRIDYYNQQIDWLKQKINLSDTSV